MKHSKIITLNSGYTCCAVLFSIILLCTNLSGFACTIFTAANGDTVLAGNNEDWSNTNTKVWFVPASEGKHGWIGFGFNTDYPDYPQGGMNDQGLFFDWAALTERSDVVFPSEKPYFNCYSPVKMFEECGTVDEAIELYKKYNEPIFRRAHILIGDSNGNAAIIEWGKDSLSIIRKSDNYQLITNFNITDPSLTGGYPCQRYNTANQMLQEGDVSIDQFRSILQAVHQEGSYPTQYSNIYDLRNRIVYVYHYHNYNNVKIFNLNEELNKGSHSYDLPSIIYTEIESPAPFESQIPGSMQLIQNYSNPFKSSTTIQYYMPISGFLSLKIYNTVGQEIETLVNEYKTEGEHEIKWIAQGIPSGVYFVRMQAGDHSASSKQRFSETKKIVITK